MALSKSEYFKNIFTTIVQSTGSIVNAQSPEELRAFVRAAKIDAAINVRNWNKFVHPIMKTLRSSPEHEFDVLDTNYGGLSGWTITTELWATEDSMECLWDFTRGQPHSITGSILCLAAKIAALSAAQDHDHEVYDDTDIKSLIECIELNLEQAKKDMFGECYIWDCDGEANLPYPVARHIHEIFKQVISGGPSLGLDGCFEGDYPTLTFEILVSKFVYDILIPSTGVEYCTGTVSSAFEALERYTGQVPCLDDTPDYSTKTPSTVPSAGNTVLNDGDDLTTGLKTIDNRMNFYTAVNALAEGGTVSGDPHVKANGLDHLILSAGSGIALEFIEAAVTGGDKIKISASGGQIDCCTLQASYDAGAASTGGKIVTKRTWPYGGTVIIEDTNESYTSASGKDIAYGIEAGHEIFKVQGNGLVKNKKLFTVGKHPLFDWDISGTMGQGASDTQSTGVAAGPSSFNYFHTEVHEDTPLSLRPVSFTPDTLGAGHPHSSLAPFPAGTQAALWVAGGNLTVPDRDGNAQIEGHLYYREPHGGDIWHLLCCGSGGDGTGQNLGQTYNFDSSGNGLADGGKIVLDVTADNPPGIHIYDGATTVTDVGGWLNYYRNPLAAIGANTQLNQSAQERNGYWSVGRAIRIQDSSFVHNEEIMVNNHLSPVAFSTRRDDYLPAYALGLDPLTTNWAGVLYSKEVTNDQGATEAHIHWRCPSDGTIYDLCGSGSGGGPGLAWTEINRAYSSVLPGASSSGDLEILADSTNTRLRFSAGSYMNVEIDGTGVDTVEYSVNPMPLNFLLDVEDEITAGVPHHMNQLWYNGTVGKWQRGASPTPISVDGGTSSAGGTANLPFRTAAVHIDSDTSKGIESYRMEFRRLVAGSGVTISYAGSGNRDILISATGGGGGGATKTTELTDVDNAWPSVDGSILSWNDTDKEYDPSTIVNVGGFTAWYNGYDVASKQHQFRTLRVTTLGSFNSSDPGNALSLATGSGRVDLRLHPQEFSLDDFGDVANTGPDYPTAGADDGAILVWDKDDAKWKKENRVAGTASLWLRPSEWDGLSHLNSWRGIGSAIGIIMGSIHSHGDDPTHSHGLAGSMTVTQDLSPTDGEPEFRDVDGTPHSIYAWGTDTATIDSTSVYPPDEWVGRGEPGAYVGEGAIRNIYGADGPPESISPFDHTSIWNNHNNNDVTRMPYEPDYTQIGGDSERNALHSTGSRWDDTKRNIHNAVVHNGIKFTINGGAVRYENQSIYCTFPTPAVYKGAAWDTHTKMRCTAYFVGPGHEDYNLRTQTTLAQQSDPSANDPWALYNNNTVSYRVSVLHDYGSGRTAEIDAADPTGTPSMLVDGMQLNQVAFGANSMTDCFKIKTSTNVTKNRQISVLEFDTFELSAPTESTSSEGAAAIKDPGGLITIRLTPSGGTGMFGISDELEKVVPEDERHPGYWTQVGRTHVQELMTHYFLGMRVDFY